MRPLIVVVVAALAVGTVATTAAAEGCPCPKAYFAKRYGRVTAIPPLPVPPPAPIPETKTGGPFWFGVEVPRPNRASARQDDGDRVKSGR